MSIRSDRISALIEQSNMSYQELEKATGIKKSSLQRYASGVTPKIPLDVIEKLSATFHVSKAYLMGWDESNSPTEPKLSEGEQALIKLFREVPEDKQQLVLQMIRAALETR